MSDLGFFAVGRDTFLRACLLGINPGTAFLVMARGSGGDNITTRWSAEAVGKRLGIRWTSARTAVRALSDAGIAATTEGSRPSYKLAKDGDLIWLPNSLVDGVGGELAPVLKLRQMQDPMALRLFGELYGAQNLREDGGVSRTITSRAYIREKLGQSGSNVVWYFTHKTTYVTWGDVTLPHKNDWSKKELAGGKSPAETYFQRAGMLESAGLIEWVPYLFEGPEGEPIHPLAWNGMDMEKELYTACVAAGRALLTQGQLDHIVKNLSGGWLVPAPAHMAHVQMYGIARLRYRPHTRMTAAWWADYNDRCAQFTSVYKAIAAKKAASSAVG